MHLLPVRCFSCNKVLGSYQKRLEAFWEEHGSTKALSVFFETHRIHRYCCQKIFMCHIDLFQQPCSDPFPSADMLERVSTQLPVKMMITTDIKKIVIAR